MVDIHYPDNDPKEIKEAFSAIAEAYLVLEKHYNKRVLLRVIRDIDQLLIIEACDNSPRAPMLLSYEHK